MALDKRIIAWENVPKNLQQERWQSFVKEHAVDLLSISAYASNAEITPANQEWGF